MPFFKWIDICFSMHFSKIEYTYCDQYAIWESKDKKKNPKMHNHWTLWNHICRSCIRQNTFFTLTYPCVGKCSSASPAFSLYWGICCAWKCVVISDVCACVVDFICVLSWGQGHTSCHVSVKLCMENPATSPSIYPPPSLPPPHIPHLIIANRVTAHRSRLFPSHSTLQRPHSPDVWLC